MLLGEREVTRAGVEQHVSPALSELSTGAIGHPSIAANLEADSNAAAIEQHVAEWVVTAADFDAADYSGRPAAEPAWLVMNAVARQVLFRNKAEELTVARDRGRVVDSTFVKHGQAEAGDEALRIGHELLSISIAVA